MKASAGRVLMLVENNFPADTRVRNEASTLVANGYRVTVVALRAPGERPHEVVDGVIVYRIPRLTVFGKLPAAKPTGFGKLLHKLRVFVGYTTEYSYFTSACLAVSLYVLVTDGFDVIHAHNPPDTLVVVAAVHKLLGRKSVFDHHDLSPELYLSRYRTNVEGLVTRGLRLLEKLSVRCADVVIATNESYRNIDIERNGAAAERVFIVRNGPDSTRVRLSTPDERLRSMNKKILVYVGAMNPQDGVEHLLVALTHLLHDLKRTDFYCVLIGSGDSVPALRAQAAALGVDDHVLFTGFIPDADLLRYLSTADICLDPNPSSPLNDVSTWIKVMEYMALSKPIVSFDLKETRVSARDAAVYVTPNNEAEFAAAIATLMDDPARRAEMGRCGRLRVATELGWHVTSQNLVRAYEVLFERIGLREAGSTAVS
ncbi:MAG TPA: glycosyltransferase family 4 protein [Vicinamibacterales bacterium]|nr:glycosyltransferase family 4 protein [Vicinamibacterales bacterium]